jgi:hypothetical protein
VAVDESIATGTLAPFEVTLTDAPPRLAPG